MKLAELRRSTYSRLSGLVFEWVHTQGAADRNQLSALAASVSTEKFGEITDEWLERRTRWQRDVDERIWQAVTAGKELF